jgi:predicted enzyme related to lactoylglutathione lyase
MLGAALHRENFLGTPMSIFPKTDTGVGGALVAGAGLSPGGAGRLVYLDVAGMLDACLDRARAAGGAVVKERTPIGPAGFLALIRDADNNLVGLHSPV